MARRYTYDTACTTAGTRVVRRDGKVYCTLGESTDINWKIASHVVTALQAYEDKRYEEEKLTEAEKRAAKVRNGGVALPPEEARPSAQQASIHGTGDSGNGDEGPKPDVPRKPADRPARNGRAGVLGRFTKRKRAGRTSKAEREVAADFEAEEGDF